MLIKQASSLLIYLYHKDENTAIDIVGYNLNIFHNDLPIRGVSIKSFLCHIISGTSTRLEVESGTYVSKIGEVQRFEEKKVLISYSVVKVY